MTHGLHSNNTRTGLPVCNVRTGMEYKGSTTPQSNGTAKATATAPEKLEPELREKIIASFSRIKHKGFAGDCLRHYARENHLYSDKELAQAVLDIQDQICTNPYAMMTTLGAEYDFLRRMVFEY